MALADPKPAPAPAAAPVAPAPAAAPAPKSKSGAPDAIPAPAATPADPSLIGGDEIVDEVKGAADWPADWKERVSAKNDKIKGWISRYGSVEAALAAGFEANQKIRSGEFKRKLDADATADEIAAYRKDVGIPETADKYEIGLPGGAAPTEADKAILDHFKGVFHTRNVPPAEAKAIVEDFYSYQAELLAARQTAARDRVIEARSSLKTEYGADYPRNLNLGKTHLDNIIGAEARNALADLALADGTTLGDHPSFVRMVVQSALAHGDDATLAQAEFGGAAGGASIAEQFNTAIELKFSDPIAYSKPEHQTKLLKLAAAVDKAKRGKAA